jgi:N-acetylmuramoyl-L-alanine amidase
MPIAQRARDRAALLVTLLACTVAGCAHSPLTGSHAPPSSAIRIVDRPVPFPPERVELTRAYIRQHYGLDVPDIRIVPRIIVLHWTAVATFKGSYDAFVQPTLQGSRPDLARAGDVNVAIQFLVDRDGTIYRLMPETWMARHVIGINYNSIGVENVGGAGGATNLTAAQVNANIALVEYLAHKYPTIRYLIGHYEYRDFEGHPLWLERDSSYRTPKLDPGPEFMTAVRAGVEDLRLKGPAEIQREKTEATRGH